MDHRRFVLFGIGGVVALLVGLTFAGLNQNLTYYLFPTEALDQRSDFADGARFRLAGLVVDGTLVEETDHLRFEVGDGGAVIPVILVNTPPPLFNEDVPVLLDGHWDGDVFLADQALIRHDENYEIPEQGGAHPDP